MPEAADLAVRLQVAGDGQLEILEPSPRDGSMRVTGRGLCPSDGHVFGLSSWNADRFVGTVAGPVSAVVMELSDGTSQWSRLRRVAGTEAQYFVIDLSLGLKPVVAVAEIRDEELLLEHRYLELPGAGIGP